ncbi:MAG: ATP-binding protein [Anaerolineae bacterium]|nr:ATP-binding protein [Anaerolineae bacterium]
MTGIPPDFLLRLKKTLLNCGPFGDERALEAVFIDARISCWRYNLPVLRTSRNEWLNAVIDFLYSQYAEDGRNALLLFLQVLQDQMQTGTGCYQALDTLAMELERRLCKDGRNSPEKLSPESRLSGYSPFIYGRPVKPQEFWGRSHELRTIFNRLRNGESTAVVGEPHIGKTSLLLKLADLETQQEFLGRDSQTLIFSSLDLHPIGNDYNPTAFWAEVLEPLATWPDKAVLAQLLCSVSDSGYARRQLERLFIHLGRHGYRLVLLLDEFERLLTHKNFQEPAFFGLLRSLATRTGGLAIVIASRLSVSQMNLRGRGLLDTGSPFFNIMIDVRMRPFEVLTVKKFLDQTSDIFNQYDRWFIYHISGRHPFLLQTLAATLFETDSPRRYPRAALDFYKRLVFHFDDLWQGMDNRARTTAVLLAFLELLQDTGAGYQAVETIDDFGAGLRRVSELALAEPVGQGADMNDTPSVIWRGESWRVGCYAFVWWVSDVFIAQTRHISACKLWVDNQEYAVMLSPEHWRQLVREIREQYGGAMPGIENLAQNLFEKTRNRVL